MLTTLLLLLFAVGCGLFVDLYAFCLGDPSDEPVKTGRVLSWLGLILVRNFHRVQNAIEFERIKDQAEQIRKAKEAYYASDGYLKHSNPWNAAKFHPKPYERINWWKATGVCPVCFNVWFSLAFFVVLMLSTNGSPWWWAFVVPFLGFSNLALRVSGFVRAHD